jgi:hypothetical protein
MPQRADTVIIDRTTKEELSAAGPTTPPRSLQQPGIFSVSLSERH